MKKNTKKVSLIEVEYSDKAVSPWGGIRLILELLHKLNITGFFNTLNLPQPGSNRGYDPAEVLKSFMVSIMIGANRFAHCGWIRYDPVLKRIFNWKETPSESTYSRFFRKFDQKRNDEVFPAIQSWFFSHFSIPRITVDLDSTVIERFGKQEGSKKGYNPRRRGRPSHHPLIAFVSELKLVVNGWLRPGNTSSSNNVEAFLEETFRILGGEKIGLLRADNGFSSGKCLTFFESLGISYIVSAKFHSAIKRMLVRDLQWIPVKKGLWVGEFQYKAGKWAIPRRCVVVRKDTEVYPNAAGHLLPLFPEMIPDTLYRYSLMFTNLTLPALQVWNLYRERSDAENRIKELKNDFAVGGFSSDKFYATEAAFRMALVAYNIMALFRLVILKDKKSRRMATLYFKCIALGSWIVSRQRKEVLKLSVSKKKRAWIDGLFKNLADFNPQFKISIA
ncbi:MAG: IS1380 family transposase [Ignavibacteriaceae bacterium]|nr:IS1380 family transposase [Ignavibacteriaceae bacterium]